MKILLVSSKYQPEYSGSGLRAHNTYKRLKQKFNIQYDVLCSSLENTGVKKYQYDGILILRIAGIFKMARFSSFLAKVVFFLNMPFEVFRVWLFIKKRINEYDLLHTFGDSWSVGFLTWYFAKHNKPIMRELCNDIPNPFYPKHIKRWIKPIFNKDNALIVAISPMLEKLAKDNGVKNIWQRPNPIDENKFNLEITKQKYQLREKLTNFNKNDIVLSYVASLWANKNQLFLLKILTLLDNKYKLVLAGVIHNDREGGKSSISSGGYIKSMKDYISKHNLEQRVQIKAEFITNPQDYMALADIYCFPSKHEGLGTPILESQACGLPIIANKLDGITDKWIDKGGVACVLDEELWLEKIKKVLEIPQEVLRDNAMNLLSVASAEVIDRQYMEYFKELKNEKPNRKI